MDGAVPIDGLAAGGPRARDGLGVAVLAACRAVLAWLGTVAARPACGTVRAPRMRCCSAAGSTDASGGAVMNPPEVRFWSGRAGCIGVPGPGAGRLANPMNLIEGGHYLPVVTERSGEEVAVFDPTRTYRYVRIRTWGPEPPAVFIGLNPTGAATNGNTRRRLIGFARYWGCGGLVQVNLFALISPKARELRRHPEPVGELNDVFIRGQCVSAAGPVIAAWGADGKHLGRGAAVTKMLLADGAQLQCLAYTGADEPRHPLYLPATSPRLPYPRKGGGMAAIHPTSSSVPSHHDQAVVEWRAPQDGKFITP